MTEVFVEDMLEATRALALFYANVPDSRALIHLDHVVMGMAPRLVDEIGAGRATKLLEAFRGAVMGQKHRIESGGPTSGTLQ